jgi:hypothetical protein
MCREMPVIPVNMVADPKKVFGQVFNLFFIGGHKVMNTFEKKYSPDSCGQNSWIEARRHIYIFIL